MERRVKLEGISRELGMTKVVEDTSLPPIVDGSQTMLMALNEISCESRGP